MRLLEMFAIEPIAYPIEIPKPPDVPKDWAKLANKLGVHIPETPNPAFEKALNEIVVGAYDEKEVDRYLRKHTPFGKRWCWRPLNHDGLYHNEAYMQAGLWVSSRSDGPGEHGQVWLRVYDKPIPYPVLVTVDKIVEKLGDSVKFLVSDYQTKGLPDPFLMVAGLSKRKIVERWDEPGFRDRSTSRMKSSI